MSSSLSGRMRISLRDLLSVLFRHKTKVLIVALAALLIAAAYAFLPPDMYASEALILVRPSSPLAMAPLGAGDAQRSRERLTGSEIAIIESRQLAEQTVQALTPETILGDAASDQPENGQALPARERALLAVQEGLKVRTAEDSDIITITFDAQDPALAQKVLDTLIGLYLARHIQVHADPVSPRFFEQQATRLEAELQTTEDKLRTFRIEHGIGNIELQTELLLRELQAHKTSQDRAERSTAAQQELDRLLALQPELERLERNLELIERDYRAYRESLQKARANSALAANKAASVSVVQPADMPLKPDRPRRPLRMGVGILIALALALATALAAEYFDSTFKTNSEVERWLQAPVFTSVPSLESLPASSAPGALPGDWLAIYRGLEAEAPESAQGAHIAAFASALPGEGASTAAREFAHACAAQLGIRVILLDAAQGNGGHAQAWGIDPPEELAQAIEKQAPLAGALAPIDGAPIALGTITTGAPASRLLSEPSFQQALDALSQEAGLIVVDAPPLSASSDALAWSRLADGVVLVIRAENTRRQAVRNVVERIALVRGELLGFVLNHRRYYIPKALMRFV